MCYDAVPDSVRGVPGNIAPRARGGASSFAPLASPPNVAAEAQFSCPNGVKAVGPPSLFVPWYLP